MFCDNGTSCISSIIFCAHISCMRAHKKTYKKTGVTSKSSDQPVHPSSIARIRVYPTVDTLVVESKYDQRRLWSDCVDAQSDPSRRRSHKYHCMFGRELTLVWAPNTTSYVEISSRMICLFVLRFYGPINPMGSCRARPVYLTTRLLGRLSPLSG